MQVPELCVPGSEDCCARNKWRLHPIFPESWRYRSRQQGNRTVQLLGVRVQKVRSETLPDRWRHPQRVDRAVLRIADRWHEGSQGVPEIWPTQSLLQGSAQNRPEWFAKEGRLAAAKSPVCRHPRVVRLRECNSVSWRLDQIIAGLGRYAQRQLSSVHRSDCRLAPSSILLEQ